MATKFKIEGKAEKNKILITNRHPTKVGLVR